MGEKRDCCAKMASVKTLLNLGLFLSAWSITTADENFVPKAENVHWVSLDFKTILSWTTKPSDYTYSVLYSMNGGDWTESPDCSRISEAHCDLSAHLWPLDRTYSADIQTEPPEMDYNTDVEDLPHTYSPEFNPYRESNISAVEFSLEATNDSKVIVSIKDPLTTLHDRHGKQFSIRDVLRNDLKYKISYHKSGSTGKRDIISDSSVANVSKLDSGESYCFIVAAFIPSRPKATQLGTWSTQQCTHVHGENLLPDLRLETWVGVAFILLTVLIIIITVTVLCCRCRQQRNRTFQTSYTKSAGIDCSPRNPNMDQAV
ncbi:tissue factor-like [Acanthochromis polyacanthus]|uniref:Tissue factor n=1 Tax=Acanthochromis polyacanthus TaxID=80966 RepID=A0A3Q1EQH4_9TELE|nr:tissue factor-like [Acanthochromis polyacanthus]